jgi:hypothetical protein
MNVFSFIFLFHGLFNYFCSSARLPVEYIDQAAQVSEVQAKQRYSESKIVVEDPLLKHGLDIDVHQIPLDTLIRRLNTK